MIVAGRRNLLLLVLVLLLPVLRDDIYNFSLLVQPIELINRFAFFVVNGLALNVSQIIDRLSVEGRARRNPTSLLWRFTYYNCIGRDLCHGLNFLQSWCWVNELD